MKVLVTGAGGQLGQTLLRTVPADMMCMGCTSSDLDISGPHLLEQIGDHGAQLVINAAAYTAVDQAETPEGRARAFAVNATGAGALAAACKSTGARLMHVSTDFVFDGEAGRPYKTDATPQPLGAYGLSKHEGERLALQALPEALIVRTAWVYSPYGNNFMKTMLRLMRERDALNVVCDQVGTPTATSTLAAVLWSFARRPALTGIYHYTDAGVASWYDFAVAIQEEALARGLLAKAIPIRPIPSKDYPLPAARPAFSVLDKSATYRDLEIIPTHWRSVLRDVLQELHGQQG